jgi:hypothetical protein
MTRTDSIAPFHRMLRRACAAHAAGATLLAVSAVAAQPPPEEEPPAQPVDEQRIKDLEEKIRVLDERTRAAEEREAEAARVLQDLRAERERLAEERKKAAAAEKKAEPPEEEEPTGPSAKLDGYVEAYYSYNINQPQNGITNFRGYDARHNTFTLSNAVLGATFDYESLSGRLALQVGHTPSTYYLAEPIAPGTGSVSPSFSEVFKYIQSAYAGWNAPVGEDGFLIQGGVFLSPIGYEGIAVKDNFNWSRSNLFFGLPAYHTGIMGTLPIGEKVTGKLFVFNGWNSVVDNNLWKSLGTQWIFKPAEPLTLSLLYFTGVERPRYAPEGEPWRHLFDAWAQVDATDWLTLALHGDGGVEPNEFGTSWWAGGAAYIRFKPADWLYLALRGDIFREEAADDGAGNVASRIFYPAELVGSGTFTADFRPHDNLSFRIEYRHDHADTDMYFAGDVVGDGLVDAYVTDASYQDTVTAGVTGWF